MKGMKWKSCGVCNGTGQKIDIVISFDSKGNQKTDRITRACYMCDGLKGRWTRK